MNPARWSRLERKAQTVIDQVLTELPPEIRAAAGKVPCLLQEWSEHDPDLLGIYCEFKAGEVSAANGPIVLYLAALDAYCREEGDDFSEQVRITYLHELGHHFGWDEDDLETRGLD